MALRRQADARRGGQRVGNTAEAAGQVGDLGCLPQPEMTLRQAVVGAAPNQVLRRPRVACGYTPANPAPWSLGWRTPPIPPGTAATSSSASNTGTTATVTVTADGRRPVGQQKHPQATGSGRGERR
jgi:hypothetical protein